MASFYNKIIYSGDCGWIVWSQKYENCYIWDTKESKANYYSGLARQESTWPEKKETSSKRKLCSNTVSISTRNPAIISSVYLLVLNGISSEVCPRICPLYTYLTALHMKKDPDPCQWCSSQVNFLIPAFPHSSKTNDQHKLFKLPVSQFLISSCDSCPSKVCLPSCSSPTPLRVISSKRSVANSVSHRRSSSVYC